MTIRSNTLTDGSIVVELDTMDDWEEFALENREALQKQYGSLTYAQRHLLDGGLMIGGGTAPEVGVYFAEEAA